MSRRQPPHKRRCTKWPSCGCSNSEGCSVEHPSSLTEDEFTENQNPEGPRLALYDPSVSEFDEAPTVPVPDGPLWIAVVEL